MICCTIKAKSFKESLGKARSLAKEADIIEIRMDSCPNIDLTTISRTVGKPIIATCLPACEGGDYTGSLSSLCKILANAGKHRIDYLTVNSSVAGRVKIPAGVRSIFAAHLARPPRDVRGSVRSILQMKNYDLVKIAYPARSVDDTIDLFNACRKDNSDGRLIALTTGEFGQLSRVLYRKFGSPMTFCHTSGDKPAADGQLAVDVMKGLFRSDKIDEKTRLFALFGSPVSQSIGPVIFNDFFMQNRIDAAYIPIHVSKPKELISVFRAFGLHGASVTAPFKRSVMPHLDSIDSKSRSIGAINTMVRNRAGIVGRNTDWSGFLSALVEFSGYRRISSSATKRFMVLGTGGAARAIIYAIRYLHPESLVYVWGRSKNQAKKLCSDLGTTYASSPSAVSCDIMINATPPNAEVGYLTHKGHGPVTGAIDATYNPPMTRFLSEAGRDNVDVMNGVNMFLFQAGLQIGFWGIKASKE